eukprot:gene8860-biopygen1842
MCSHTPVHRFDTDAPEIGGCDEAEQGTLAKGRDKRKEGERPSPSEGAEFATSPTSLGVAWNSTALAAPSIAKSSCATATPS